MRILVDTNVYLDFLLERGRHSNAAYSVFAATIACHHEIVLSDAILRELERYASSESIRGLFLILKPKVRTELVSENDRHNAKGMDSNDAIHAALANRVRAVVVTRNIRDFRGLAQAVLPEQLIS